MFVCLFVSSSAIFDKKIGKKGKRVICPGFKFPPSDSLSSGRRTRKTTNKNILLEFRPWPSSTDYRRLPGPSWKISSTSVSVVLKMLPGIIVSQPEREKEGDNVVQSLFEMLVFVLVYFFIFIRTR